MAHIATAATRTGITVLVAVVAFVTALDNTVITVALPSIAAQLRLGPGELEWVGLSYMLAFSGLLLVAGAAVDRFGQRRLLLAGLTVFGLAAAAGGVATSAAGLIVARTVQGAAAALVLPATLSTIRTGLPERQRDTAAAVWTAAIAVALALGPLLGGALTQYLRWNWVLWINIPFALLGLVLVRAVPEHREGRPAPMAWGSAALVTVAVVASTAVLVTVADGVRPGLIVVLGGIAVLAGWLFVRSGARLVPRVLLRDKVFTGSLGIQLLWGLGVSGVFFFTPLFLQDALRLQPAASGLPLLAVAVAVAVATPFVAGGVRRIGVGRAVGIGLFVVAAGLCAVAIPGARPQIGELLPGLVLVGLGSAFTTPLAASALTAAGAEQAGIASGLLSADRELASSLGVALIGAVLNLRRVSALAAGHTAPDAYAAGYLAGLLVAAGLQVAAGVLAWRLLRKAGA